MYNELLIDAVFKRTPIWDKKSKYHWNRSVVDMHWKEISAEMVEDACANDGIRSTDSHVDEDEVRVYSDLDQNDNRHDEHEEGSSCASSSAVRGLKRKRGLERRKLEDLHLKPSRNRDLDDDEDILFFKSLLSHVKKIPESRKLSFRSRVQEIVEQFAYGTGTSSTRTTPISFHSSLHSTDTHDPLELNFHSISQSAQHSS
ncbi:uncharacterized protein LOC128891258 isoform X2 [Hylaeus anthracinus]|uniref:uncharacterized protein LOC128882054 isoform X2 n=1 Tax=Hylaeus volcanicus TaxID=313075 RepID=UPI0023B817A9|nr:uncharacterized protein LOC128882054 isoform X2 [Hylaeus volcanicus]XP_054006641.1 uncharacterized protein LOC128891258 isoform X2 [Hylaeus anthracinus]